MSTEKKKYLKYKKKYLELKTQLGGGLEPDVLKWRLKTIRSGSDKFINKLGPNKIVATPPSGQSPRELVQLWNELSDSHEKIKELYLKKNINLGVYILDDDKQADGGCNLIIFYSVDDLENLAKASQKSPEELLKIFAIATTDDFKLDLIKIAFGDIFGNGIDTTPLQTEEGKKILKIYEELQKIDEE